MPAKAPENPVQQPGGLSHEEVAARSGASVATVGRWSRAGALPQLANGKLAPEAVDVARQRIEESQRHSARGRAVARAMLMEADQAAAVILQTSQLADLADEHLVELVEMLIAAIDVTGKTAWAMALERVIPILNRGRGRTKE